MEDFSLSVEAQLLKQICTQKEGRYYKKMLTIPYDLLLEGSLHQCLNREKFAFTVFILNKKLIAMKTCLKYTIRHKSKLNAAVKKNFNMQHKCQSL